MSQEQEQVEAVDMNDIATAISDAGIECKENSKGELLCSSAGCYITQNKKGTFVMARASTKDDEFGAKHEVESVDDAVNVVETRNTRKEEDSGSNTTDNSSNDDSDDSDEVAEEDDSGEDSEDVEPEPWVEEDGDNDTLVKQMMDMQTTLSKLQKEAKKPRKSVRINQKALKKVIKEEVDTAVDKILHRAKEYTETGN